MSIETDITPIQSIISIKALLEDVLLPFTSKYNSIGISYTQLNSKLSGVKPITKLST